MRSIEFCIGVCMRGPIFAQAPDYIIPPSSQASDEFLEVRSILTVWAFAESLVVIHMCKFLAEYPAETNYLPPPYPLLITN